MKRIIIVFKSIFKTLKFKLFKIKTAICQFFRYWSEFGLFLAKVQLKEIMTSKRLGYSDYYIENASKYMLKELQPIINKYRETPQNAFSATDQSVSNPEIKVWICWWQGYENMPPVVRACYHRVLEIFQSDKAQVVLITHRNYNNYISIPDYIIKKHKQGLIGNAHFADILRWGLIAKYGGFWIDACLFLTYNSFNNIERSLQYPFYTQRFINEKECPHEPCRGLWCNGYFMGKHKPNIRIFNFVYDSLLFYWKKHNFAFHYVFLDYILWAGYVSIDDIKKLIDNVPANNKHIWYLMSKMNEPCNDEEWQEALAKNGFYKLTYRKNYKEYTDDGKITYYGRVMKYNKNIN